MGDGIGYFYKQIIWVGSHVCKFKFELEEIERKNKKIISDDLFQTIVTTFFIRKAKSITNKLLQFEKKQNYEADGST